MTVGAAWLIVQIVYCCIIIAFVYFIYRRYRSKP